MKCSFVLLLSVALIGQGVAGGESEVPHGPPASPLSWQDVKAPRNDTEIEFSPRHNLLGMELQAISVKRVEFYDVRPYGEGEQRSVWLTRYESVPIMAPDSSHVATVPVSLAFDVATQELLCAFTDAAPVWAQSPLTSAQIEALSDGCAFAPAHYRELQSTVSEVLQTLWKVTHVDPSMAGQIVMRPRYATCRVPFKRVEKQIVPLRAPENMWLVEVLGSVVMQKGDWRATTLVVEYGDADRKIENTHYSD